MCTGPAHGENSMEVPQNIKNRSTFEAAVPILGIHHKNTKALIWREMYSYVHCRTTTTAKLWKQLSSLKQMSGSRRCSIYTQWNTAQL